MNYPPQIKSYPDTMFRAGGQAVIPFNMEYSRKLARQFSEQAFDNLDQFPYVYMTSGISEAIDWILPRQKASIDASDYRYAMAYATPWPRVSGDRLRYVSYPFSGTGHWPHLPSDKAVFLDCAYLFASDMTHNRVLPDNVKYVAFSLSKSHNIADYRIGWLFSKEQVNPQHIVQYDYDYGPSRHADAINMALLYAPNHLYLKHQDEFSELYSRNGLSERRTNLFGIDDSGVRIPYYQLLPRHQNQPESSSQPAAAV